MSGAFGITDTRELFYRPYNKKDYNWYTHWYPKHIRTGRFAGISQMPPEIGACGGMRSLKFTGRRYIELNRDGTDLVLVSTDFWGPSLLFSD